MGLSPRLMEGSTWGMDQKAPQAALYSMMGKLEEVGARPGSSKVGSLVVLLRDSAEAATCRSDLLSGGDSLVTARRSELQNVTARLQPASVNKAPMQHNKALPLQKDKLRQWGGSARTLALQGNEASTQAVSSKFPRLGVAPLKQQQSWSRQDKWQTSTRT